MVSICIIGSEARQDGDILSDKDLLAIGCPVEIRNTVSRYVEDGWNIAQFSKREFDAMAGSKSLFVQHVKQDGRVVRDDDGYLVSVLDCYKINQNYHHELSSAIEPILSLGEPEESYWGLLFQADILYVSIRNSCILHRATDAAPEFDFKVLVQWVSGVAGLTTAEEELLLHLRSLKYAYRVRSTKAEVSQVCRMIEVAKKLAGYWSGITCSDSTVKKPSNGYFDMRGLEKELVCSVGPIYMDELCRRHELADLWTRICRSGPYEKKPKLECLPRWSEQVSVFLAEQHYH